MKDLNPFKYDGTDLVNVITKQLFLIALRMIFYNKTGEAALLIHLHGNTNQWDKVTKQKLQIYRKEILSDIRSTVV